MNGARQLGRVVEPPPIERLATPDARWREVHEDQVEEGAHCHEKRGEQDTLDDDCGHSFADKQRAIQASCFSMRNSL